MSEEIKCFNCNSKLCKKEEKQEGCTYVYYECSCGVRLEYPLAIIYELADDNYCKLAELEKKQKSHEEFDNSALTAIGESIEELENWKSQHIKGTHQTINDYMDTINDTINNIEERIEAIEAKIDKIYISKEKNRVFHDMQREIEEFREKFKQQDKLESVLKEFLLLRSLHSYNSLEKEKTEELANKL